MFKQNEKPDNLLSLGKTPQRAVTNSGEGIPLFAEMEECSQGIHVSRGSNKEFIYGEAKTSETLLSKT